MSCHRRGALSSACVCEPAFHIGTARHAVLQLLQRVDARLGAGDLPGRVIEHVVLVAQVLLEFGQQRLFLGQLGRAVHSACHQAPESPGADLPRPGRLQQAAPAALHAAAARAAPVARARVAHARSFVCSTCRPCSACGETVLQVVAAAMAWRGKPAPRAAVSRFRPPRLLRTPRPAAGRAPLPAPLVETELGRRQLRCAAFKLGAQGRQLMFDAAAVLAHVLDLLLEPRDLGVGFVKRALRRVHLVAGGSAGLRSSSSRRSASRRRAVSASSSMPSRSISRAWRSRVAAASLPLQQPQQVLRRPQLPLQFVIAAGDLGLRPADARAACRVPGGYRRRAAGSRACRASRNSVSRRRSRYFETPAASSRNTRSSSGLASMMREIMPCSMIA